ncbi:hypothetical protein TNCT6_12370 [Streptomyces sp. 6-11-2]|nr:hypothetical protein TNCT6_12370 [Streptomyces sp. 6-11-2]
MCGNENECLEIAVASRGVLARDSKVPCLAPVRFAAPAWKEFLHALTRGELGDS